MIYQAIIYILKWFDIICTKLCKEWTQKETKKIW